MAFANKYRLQFDETIGGPGGNPYTEDTWQVNIMQDGFGGSVTYLKGNGSSPLEINYANIELHKQQIMDSEAIINLYIDSFNQLSDVVLSDPFTYKVEIYRNASLYWTGWVEPGDYEEDYVESKLIPCSIRAVDGLQYLDVYRVSVATPGTPRSLFSYIDEILDNLSLNLGYKENVNLYDTLMDSTAADSPLTQGLLYPKTFYTDDGQVSYDCRTALKMILQAMGCYIVQKDGNWVINFIPENDGTSYTQRTFNSSAVYQSNTSVDEVVELTNVGTSQVRALTKLRTRRASKKVISQHSLYTGFNLVADGEFDDHAWYDTNPSGSASYSLNRWTENSCTASISTFSGTSNATYAAVELATGTTGGYLESELIPVNNEMGALDFSFHYKCSYSGSGTSPTIKYMIKWVSKQGDEYAVKYVNSSSNWTDTTTTLTFTGDGTRDNAWDRHTRTTIDAVPSDGYIQVRLYEVEPGTRTVSNFYYDHVRLEPTNILDAVPEKHRIESSDSDPMTEIIEIDETVIGDKGTYARYGFFTGAYAYLQFEIDFGSVVNGEQVSFDILGTTRTFEYQASPVRENDEFNSASQLVLSILGYTQGHYSVWTTNEGVNLDDIYIEAHWFEEETNEDYGWGTPSYDTNITQVSKTDPSSPGSIASTSPARRGALVISNNGGYDRTGQWTDGNISGSITRIMHQFIQAQYGAPNSQHRGTVIDFSKSLGPTSIIHDGLYNNGKYFLFTGGTFFPMIGEWEGQWQEVITTGKTLTFTITPLIE